MCEKLTEDFSENEDKNHADKESGLLSSTTDTSITDNTDGETGGKTSKTDGETSTELDETSVEGLLLAELVGDQHGNDETVNGNDTSHNDGNNVLMHVSSWIVMLAMEVVKLVAHLTTGSEESSTTSVSHVIVNVLLTIRSGLRTPMAEIPTPALAVP